MTSYGIRNPRARSDIGSSVDWLRLQSNVDTGRLVVIGHSVGAAAALLSASRRPDLAFVVNVSSFAHPGEAMRRWMEESRMPYMVIGWYVVRYVQKVIAARFADIAPVSTISRVDCPVF